MRRFALLLIVSALAAACAHEGGGPKTDSGGIIPARVVRLPVQFARAEALSDAKLTLDAGAEDELPEGPASFDVLDSGLLAIADPVAERVALYDQDGNYRGEVKTGVAVDGVWAQGERVAVRDASTGNVLVQSANGFQPTVDAAVVRTPTVPARLLAANRAVVPSSRGEHEGLNVTWDDQITRLISVEHLGDLADGSAVIALEVTPGDLASVRKLVRRYAPDGRVVGEVPAVPIDYYVLPRDEFRIRKGKLYHLEPLESEVRISVWDLAGAEDQGDAR
jgi:hypothetical protein